MDTHDKTADTLLRMIENVSPDDTATLDEIDARVEQYLRGTEYLPLVYKYYTKSRDALKAIRPEGWAFTSGAFLTGPAYEYGTSYNALKVGERTQRQSPCLSTEELAELHAIIQAIEYERSQ